MLRVDSKSAFHRDFVAIAPGELVFGPIEIRTVAVGRKDVGKDRPVRRSDQLESFDMRFVGGRDISKTDGELQGPSLRIIEVESRDASETDERLQEEIKAGPNFRLGGVAGFPGFLGLEIETDVRMNFSVDIYLRQELKRLSIGGSTGKQEQD